MYNDRGTAIAMNTADKPLLNERYYSELRALCRRKGFRLRLLGRVGAVKAHPLFAVSLRGDGRLPVTVLVGGVHGDEISGPLALLEFLRRHRPRPADPPIIVLPLCNPHGSERQTRRNHARLDLNRHFLDPRRPADVRLLTAPLLRRRLGWFISCHEDDSGQYYLHAYDRRRHETYRLMAVAGTGVFPLTEQRPVRNVPLNDGIIYDTIDGSFEHWASRHGAKYSVCIEVPDDRPMSDRIRLILRLIGFAIADSRRRRIR